MRRLLIVIVGAVVAGAACRAGRPDDARILQPDSASLATARRAATSLGGDLLGMLTRALEEGGPEAAIGYCADSAQARTARHRAAGVEVRRVGTRVRNPANAPDSVERAVLDAFAEALARQALPADTAFVLRGADGAPRVHYLRPIVVGEPCLACHGAPDRIAPAVRQILAARYPSDRAVGYRVGELRGAVSVRVTP